MTSMCVRVPTHSLPKTEEPDHQPGGYLADAGAICREISVSIVTCAAAPTLELSRQRAATPVTAGLLQGGGEQRAKLRIGRGIDIVERLAVADKTARPAARFELGCLCRKALPGVQRARQQVAPQPVAVDDAQRADLRYLALKQLVEVGLSVNLSGDRANALVTAHHVVEFGNRRRAGGIAGNQQAAAADGRKSLGDAAGVDAG